MFDFKYIFVDFCNFVFCICKWNCTATVTEQAPPLQSKHDNVAVWNS